MKKVFHLSIPFILACLFISTFFFLASASSGVTAAAFPSSNGGSIIVNTLEDELNSDGDCSLREAVGAANINAAVDACPAGYSVGIDTISFSVRGKITLNSQLEITQGGPLIVDGRNGITLSGNNSTRIFYIHINATAELRNLNFINGYAFGAGGGVLNDGKLIVTNGTFSHNLADSNGGALCNSGTMTVTHSLIADNYTLRYGGGGIDNWMREPGITPTLYVAYSTLTGNSSAAIDNWLGDVTIANSTLSGNINYGAGGAVCNWKNMKIINSTLSGNQAQNGGAIFYWGSTLAITNSTIVDNAAMEGAGGLLNGSGAPATVYNSIIAYSLSGDNCSGMPLGSESNNIEDTDTCGFELANGSKANTNPMIGHLQFNGGPTWTHALLPGSPAIDNGNNILCPTIDQRGTIRPVDGDGIEPAVCDIGAYEYNPLDVISSMFIPIMVR